MDGPSAAEMGLTSKDLGIQEKTQTTSNSNEKVVKNPEQLILKAGSPELLLKKQEHDWINGGPKKREYASANGIDVTILGIAHSSNPDNSMNVGIRTAFSEFQAKNNNPSSNVAIVEGFNGGIPNDLREYALNSTNSEQDYKSIVEKRGEQAGTVFLALRAGMEVESAEVPQQYVFKQLAEAGIPTDQVVLFYLIRDLPGLLKQSDPTIQRGNIARELYRVATETGTDWIPSMSQEDMQKMGQDEEFRNKVLTEIVGSTIPHINEAMNAVVGGELFATNPDGSIKINITDARARQLTSQYYNKDYDALFKIAEIDHGERDKFLFQSIRNNVTQGKNTFVTFGDSHVSAIEPALDSIYAKQPKAA